jgi:hypothetical protein
MHELLSFWCDVEEFPQKARRLTGHAIETQVLWCVVVGAVMIAGISCLLRFAMMC